jgi:hypothetical protein
MEICLTPLHQLRVTDTTGWACHDTSNESNILSSCFIATYGIKTAKMHKSSGVTGINRGCERNVREIASAGTIISMYVWKQKWRWKLG